MNVNTWWHHCIIRGNTALTIFLLFKRNTRWGHCHNHNAPMVYLRLVLITSCLLIPYELLKRVLSVSLSQLFYTFLYVTILRSKQSLVAGATTSIVRVRLLKISICESTICEIHTITPYSYFEYPLESISIG